MAVFLAGDGVDPMNPATVATFEGRGTGKRAALRHLDGRIHVSRRSSHPRGQDETALAGWPARFSTPATLIDLSLAAETVLCD